MVWNDPESPTRLMFLPGQVCSFDGSQPSSHQSVLRRSQIVTTRWVFVDGICRALWVFVAQNSLKPQIGLDAFTL